MSITHTDFLSDRVIVRYRCKTPWTAQDEQGVVEVPYRLLPTLPGPPPLSHHHGECREVCEEVDVILAQNATISFHFGKWQETDECRMEKLIGGPFLAVLENPPDSAPLSAGPKEYE